MTERRLAVIFGKEVAEAICEHIADGQSVSEIAEMPGMPSRNTIYRWLALYPKFFDAFTRAKEVSAMTFEEKALAIAAKLEGKHDFTSAYISGLNYAMQQYRWTAARRNKTEYGQQVQQLTAVPITINTTLNLGQEGMGPATEVTSSVYTIEAREPITNAVIEDSTEEDTIDQITIQGEVIELPSQISDDDKPVSLKRAPRRRKGHKAPGRAAATAARYANRKKETE